MSDYVSYISTDVKNNIISLLRCMNKLNVFVIGDIMLDHFMYWKKVSIKDVESHGRKCNVFC